MRNLRIICIEYFQYKKIRFLKFWNTIFEFFFSIYNSFHIEIFKVSHYFLKQSHVGENTIKEPRSQGKSPFPKTTHDTCGFYVGL
jgi:hypothetical protein